MKLFNTCALCAALTLPALVQTVSAEVAAEDVVLEILEKNVNLQIQFIEDLEAIISEETSLEAGLVKLKASNDKLSALLSSLSQLSEEESEMLQFVMSDEEYLKDAKEFSAAVQEMLDLVKSVNYLDNADIKAACAEFAALCDYKV